MRKLVFLLPGRSYTDGFLNSWTETFHYFTHHGDYEVYSSQYPGSDVYTVRNRILFDQFPGEHPHKWSEYKPCKGMPYDWLIWLDSDQIWSHEQIERLISHDVDIVAGVTPIDSNPFSTRCAAGYWDLSSANNPITNLDMSGFQGWRELALAKDPSLVNGDLLRVDWVGFGFLAVRYGVFEALAYPWFRHTTIVTDRYQIECSEDTGWCRRALDAGFKLYIDPSIIVGHQKTVVMDERSVKQAIFMKWKAGVRVVPKKGLGAATELEEVKA